MTRSARLVVAAALILAAACSSDDGEASRSARPERASGPSRFHGVDFYAPPDPLPEGDPGDLLRYQAVDPPGAGEAASWWRVMYLSESVHDEAIAVTGLVGVPSGPAPTETDGRPVLSVGHGTTGIADSCAPSRLSPQLAELERRLGMPAVTELAGSFVDAGYVVAVTDYEGLGTPGVHPYLVGESAGRSVLDAAQAARQLPDAGAGDRLALWGYSQGGHAVVWAAQLVEEWAPDLDLAGTVAGAPGSELPTMFAATGAAAELNNRFLLMVAGFAAAYPEADPALVLTDAGAAALDALGSGDACGAIGVDLGPARGRPVARDGFARIEPWASVVAENDPGHVATGQPLLVVHSAADDTVPLAFSETLVDRMCGLGQVVELRALDRGEGHVAAMDDAVAEGLPWIDERLDGIPAADDCGPLRSSYVGRQRDRGSGTVVTG